MFLLRSVISRLLACLDEHESQTFFLFFFFDLRREADNSFDSAWQSIHLLHTSFSTRIEIKLVYSTQRRRSSNTQVCRILSHCRVQLSCLTISSFPLFSSIWLLSQLFRIWSDVLVSFEASLPYDRAGGNSGMYEFRDFKWRRDFWVSVPDVCACICILHCERVSLSWISHFAEESEQITSFMSIYQSVWQRWTCDAACCDHAINKIFRFLCRNERETDSVYCKIERKTIVRIIITCIIIFHFLSDRRHLLSKDLSL